MSPVMPSKDVEELPSSICECNSSQEWYRCVLCNALHAQAAPPRSPPAGPAQKRCLPCLPPIAESGWSEPWTTSIKTLAL
eukprot:6197810-Pleurochrysis_carterae.AAC.1